MTKKSAHRGFAGACRIIHHVQSLYHREKEAGDDSPKVLFLERMSQVAITGPLRYQEEEETPNDTR